MSFLKIKTRAVEEEVDSIKQCAYDLSQCENEFEYAQEEGKKEDESEEEYNKRIKILDSNVAEHYNTFVDHIRSFLKAVEFCEEEFFE